MRRRTLDIIFSSGLVAIAGLLVVIGLVMTSNANFSKNYVKTQLAEQKITFKQAADLTEEEQAKACLVKYAGEALTTGKQAECYANDFIGLHLESTADGMTYAEIGVPQGEARAELAKAQAAGDAAAIATAQKQVTDLTQQRETLFKGETLRGLLLTSFGFATLGEKAAQAATVAYLGAAVLLVLALFGFIHAFRTPKDKGFAVVPDTVDDIEKMAKV